MHIEPPTMRQLVASMMGGPPGKLLTAAEYVKWLDEGNFDDVVFLAEGSCPLDEPEPRIRRRRGTKTNRW